MCVRVCVPGIGKILVLIYMAHSLAHFLLPVTSLAVSRCVRVCVY